MAWLPQYKDGMSITYKDKDIHNIRADNLNVVTPSQYVNYIQRNSGYKAASLAQRKRKLDIIIEEATLTRAFLETRDFLPINRHVDKHLIGVLKDYCVLSLHLGLNTTQRLVPEAIARMYEVLDAGYCLVSFERYCKKMLLNYKKKGSFGVLGIVPKSIWANVEQLNFNCLCERYNVKK